MANHEETLVGVVARVNKIDGSPKTANTKRLYSSAWGRQVIFISFNQLARAMQLIC